MNPSLPNPTVFRQLGLGLILLILWGIITLTLRIGFRLGKVDKPKLKVLFAIGFLQTLLGAATLFIIEKIEEKGNYIALLSGLGMVFLSGLLLIKITIKHHWQKTLHIWAIATGMQLVLIPVCSIVMWVCFVIVGVILYPPQF
ncbi:MAG: hypothetical protein AB2L18_08740 [Anaerolineaceae bacterium]